MTSTHEVNIASSSAATGCCSTIKVMVVTQDATSERVVQALLERTSRLLAHPLAMALYRQDQRSLPLERSLINLLQGDEGEKLLVLPWHVSLSGATLIETAQHALAGTAHETVVKRRLSLRRRSTSGLASFGPFEGIRNLEEDLDRLIAFSPGWHHEGTWLGAGTRSVLLPCHEHAGYHASIATQQQLLSMMQAVEAALLPSRSISASLRTDGEVTVSYLVRRVSDLVMLHAATAYPAE